MDNTKSYSNELVIVHIGRFFINYYVSRFWGLSIKFTIFVSECYENGGMFHISLLHMSFAISDKIMLENQS
jgi:hypothetical protein